MNYSTISGFIWGTADLLRSSFKQHQYGDIILPFTVMRRLDVVLAPTKQAVLEEVRKPLPEFLKALPQDDREAYLDNRLRKAAAQSFYNTSAFTMESLLDEEADIKENITAYIAGFSPEIVDILGNFNIYDVIKDLDKADLLFLVTERFCDPKMDLSPSSVSNADMGDIYEERTTSSRPSWPCPPTSSSTPASPPISG